MGPGLDSQGSVTSFQKYYFPNLHWIHGKALEVQSHPEEFNVFEIAKRGLQWSPLPQGSVSLFYRLFVLLSFRLFNFLSFVFSCLFNFSSLRIFVCLSIRLFVFSTFSFLVFSVKMSSLWLLHVHIIVDQQTVPWPLGLDFVHSSFQLCVFLSFQLCSFLVSACVSYWSDKIILPANSILTFSFELWPTLHLVFGAKCPEPQIDERRPNIWNQIVALLTMTNPTYQTCTHI